MRYFLILLIYCGPCVLLAQNNTNYNAISFVQDDSIYTISTDTATVYLKKSPFSIQYFGKVYNYRKDEFSSLKVAVLPAPDSISDSNKGISETNFPYFAGGTGFAAHSYGYPSFFVSNSGHQYMFYESETEKRVQKIGSPRKNKGQLLLFEFDITAFFFSQEEDDIPIEAMPNTSLYFVILADRNLNKKIEPQELKK